MRRIKTFSFIAALITILVFSWLAHAADPAQQNNKTLISLTHSGNDPVGFMLFTLLKHQMTGLDNFQLASQSENPIIRLELITFDPDETDAEHKDMSCGYATVWTSTEGYHVMAAAGVSGRDRLKPIADEILVKTQELIPTAKQHNEKSSVAHLRHIVGLDLLTENDELRDRLAGLQDKVNALEMELAAEKKKNWWQRLWGWGKMELIMAIINAILMAILCGITGYYARATHKILRANEKIVEVSISQRELQLRPFIVFRREATKDFVVENIGNGAALDVWIDVIKINGTGVEFRFPKHIPLLKSNEVEILKIEVYAGGKRVDDAIEIFLSSLDPKWTGVDVEFKIHFANIEGKKYSLVEIIAPRTFLIKGFRT